MTTAYIGKTESRVEGRPKVTGSARYSGEYDAPDLAYGFVVSSTIPRGRIGAIDTGAALRLPGVLHVFTHENSPRPGNSDDDYRDDAAPPGSPFRPLSDAEIRYSAQPVALVVAEGLELARYAASLVKVEYEREAHSTDLDRERQEVDDLPTVLQSSRGDAQKAFDEAAVRVEAEYRVPCEHHNAMELFATTVVLDDDGRLTVYDKTQGVQNDRTYLCNVFGCSADELRVVSPFVGGAFGSALHPQHQVFLAVLAARELKRSVRVSLTRQQMFGLTRRPLTWQRVALGAESDGALRSVIHEAEAETSRYEDYSESVVEWSGLLYRCDNVDLRHRLVKLDLSTPGDMRAPGAVWGLFALECAMDELAHRCGIDPIELRLRNYTDRDLMEDRPFSSKELRACYRLGAGRFGWARRNPEPRSMREGDRLVGWGMASGVWYALRTKAKAKATLTPDLRLTVGSAASDIGTGTQTIMTQIAADTVGLPIGNVTVGLADSALPAAPLEGGSMIASTVGPAVGAVCARICKRLFQRAQRIEGSPLAGVAIEDVVFADARISLRDDPSRAVSLSEAMRHGRPRAIEEEASAGPGPEEKKFSRYAHSAVFAEVTVDPDLGTVRVKRVVTAVAAGRVLNPKTARSQAMGAIAGGIGTALFEESVIDHAFGRFVTRNLADYHVPVNADVDEIDVIFVDEEDEGGSALRVKGLGEIGIIGVAAAIANAVFHATGKRIRELPITHDKLL